MSLEYAAELDVGAHKRKQGRINEDSLAVNILQDGHLDRERSAGIFVLADGAGGEESGEIASYIASVEATRHLTHTLWETRRIGEVLSSRPQNQTDGKLDTMSVSDPVTEKNTDWMLNKIRAAVQHAHTGVLGAIQQLRLDSAYTTIVVGVKINDAFYLGWVGDSRAYTINCHPKREEEDRVSLLTRDHSVVGQMVEQGKIDEIEAHVHRKGNQVTRALGGTKDVEPGKSTVQVETREVQIYADDTVMLTSDGLVDAYVDAPKLHEEYQNSEETEKIEQEILEKSVTDDELGDIIMEAPTLDDAANQFVRLANARGGKDNISMILFQDHSLAQSPEYGLPDRTYDTDGKPIIDETTIIQDIESE